MRKTKANSAATTESGVEGAVAAVAPTAAAVDQQRQWQWQEARQRPQRETKESKALAHRPRHQRPAFRSWACVLEPACTSHAPGESRTPSVRREQWSRVPFAHARPPTHAAPSTLLHRSCAPSLAVFFRARAACLAGWLVPLLWRFFVAPSWLGPFVCCWLRSLPGTQMA